MLSNSAFKHSINTLNERLFNSGIGMAQLDWSLEYLRVYNRRANDGTSSGKLQPLTLHRIDGILVLLIGGLGLGCTVFILEIFWKRIAKFQSRKKLQLCWYGRVWRQKKQRGGVRRLNKSELNEKSKIHTSYCVSTK